MSEAREPEGQSFYDHVGGHETFVRLTDAFFEGIVADEDLLAMYRHDLEGAKVRLMMFLEQYWGGPMTYSQTRGAPRLKMRHMPYKITPRMRDKWLAKMNLAIDGLALGDEETFLMRDYSQRAADFLVNCDE